MLVLWAHVGHMEVREAKLVLAHSGWPLQAPVQSLWVLGGGKAAPRASIESWQPQRMSYVCGLPCGLRIEAIKQTRIACTMTKYKG